MKYSFQFSLLMGLTVFATLIANVLSTLVAPYPVGPFMLSGGFIVFPLVYVLSDVVSEVYGYGASRKIGWVSMLANLLMSLVFIGMYTLLGEEHGAGIKQLAVTNWIIVLASLAAGQIGDWANDAVFAMMKQGRLVKLGYWARAIGSSIAGETIDSITFVFGGLVVAFHVPVSIAFIMVGSQILFKLLTETVFFPLTVALKNMASHYDNDAYRMTHRYDILGVSK